MLCRDKIKWSGWVRSVRLCLGKACASSQMYILAFTCAGGNNFTLNRKCLFSIHHTSTEPQTIVFQEPFKVMYGEHIALYCADGVNLKSRKRSSEAHELLFLKTFNPHLHSSTKFTAYKNVDQRGGTWPGFLLTVSSSANGPLHPTSSRTSGQTSEHRSLQRHAQSAPAMSQAHGQNRMVRVGSVRLPSAAVWRTKLMVYGTPSEHNGRISQIKFGLGAKSDKNWFVIVLEKLSDPGQGGPVSFRIQGRAKIVVNGQNTRTDQSITLQTPLAIRRGQYIGLHCPFQLVRSQQRPRSGS